MNEELQRGIIADFLCGDIDRAHLRKLVESHGLKPHHFTDSVLRTAYDAIIATETDDKVLLIQSVEKKCGQSFDSFVGSASPAVGDAEARIRELANSGVVNEARDEFNATLCKLKGKASPQFAIEEATRRALNVVNLVDSASGAVGVPLADIADPIPEEQNPNALFRGGWLRKGLSAMLASVTGSGKSVITIQMSYAWAAGRPIFGIEPIRPLRIGIFQTEDDDEELSWFRSSMRTGYASFCDWTQDDISAAEQNIFFHKTNFRVGRDFANLLAEVQRANRYDLIIVNPLQGVCGCDVVNNNEMRQFLTEMLDPVIKDPNNGCGLLIVHHTNKPITHNGQQGYGNDTFAEYSGSGASTLANWARAILVILPTTKERGQYKLIAAKRGKHLNWPKLEDVKGTKPTRIICHAPEDMRIVFWLEDDSKPAPSDEICKPDPKTDAELLARELRKTPRSLTEARDLAREMFGKSKHRNEIAYDTVIANLNDYGLVIAPSGVGRLFVIGTPEGAENAISSIREKKAQKLLAKL